MNFFVELKLSRRKSKQKQIRWENNYKNLKNSMSNVILILLKGYHKHKIA